MKLKDARKAFAMLFVQSQGSIFNDLMLSDIKIVESKKNKKKQRFSLTVKTTWEVAKFPKNVNADNQDTATQPEKPVAAPVEQVVEKKENHDNSVNQAKEQHDAEIQKLVNQINKLQREIHALKGENSELSRQLYELQETQEKNQKILLRKEEMITEARRENYELKQLFDKNSYVQPTTRPSTNPSNATLLQFGSETEFYENEILSFTRKALEYALKFNVRNNSRYQHILQDILQANPLEKDVRAEKNDELDKLMRHYQKMDNTTYNALRKFGFTISEDGAHYKLVFGGDGRYTCSAAKTSSDRNSGKNWVRDVGNLLF